VREGQTEAAISPISELRRLVWAPILIAWQGGIAGWATSAFLPDDGPRFVLGASVAVLVWVVEGLLVAIYGRLKDDVTRR
jgi:hypothetical protein